MKKEEVRELLSLDKSIEVTNVTKEEGVVNVFVKSTKKKARCVHCNNFSNKIHDTLKPAKVLYLDNSGAKTYLIVTKRRFYCKYCKKTFTEDLELTNRNGTISLKTTQKVLKDYLDKNKTIAMISKENHLSEDTARTIFLEAMKNYPKHIERLPEVISFDETSTYTNEGTYSFILNDPLNRVTLDILKSRRKDYLIEYFSYVKNRNDVKVVIIDLYVPYKEVIKVCFPRAIIVADIFHYISYITAGLDAVRMRLVNEFKENKKSYEYKMFKSRLNKGLLLKSFSETKGELKKLEHQNKMYEEGRTKNKPKDKFNDYWYGKIKIKSNNKFIETTRVERLDTILNLNQELYEAYNLKEDFMRIITNVKYKDAKHQLKQWIKKCYESNIPEMISAANTINNWLEEIVNSFLDDRYSNGFTEANNNIITKIVNTAYGYKNFEFFRLRTLVILHQSYSISDNKKVKNSASKK